MDLARPGQRGDKYVVRIAAAEKSTWLLRILQISR